MYSGFHPHCTVITGIHCNRPEQSRTPHLQSAPLSEVSSSNILPYYQNYKWRRVSRLLPRGIPHLIILESTHHIMRHLKLYTTHHVHILYNI